jgi:hypothetical protein
MQGAQKLRSEAYLHVRCNDEVEAQRSRWTFYETIKYNCSGLTPKGRNFFMIAITHCIESSI